MTGGLHVGDDQLDDEAEAEHAPRARRRQLIQAAIAVAVLLVSTVFVPLFWMCWSPAFAIRDMKMFWFAFSP